VRRGSGIVSVVLLAVLAAGCRADTAAPVADRSTPSADPATPSADPATASADPLPAPDATPGEVRDALLDAIVVSGGIRARVTGGPHVVTFELWPSGPWGDLAGERIRWREHGTVREQLVLPSARVCVNRAEGRALEMRGDRVYSAGNDSVEGTFHPSGRPYSCTQRSRALDVGSLLTSDLRRLDPVRRLGGVGTLEEELHLADLGMETDGGETVRHLRLAAVENDTADRRIPTTFDLWVDDDLHLVRAEFSRLDRKPGRLAATFTYGGVPALSRPAAADRGPLDLTLVAPSQQVSTSDPEGDVDPPHSRSWFVPSADITTFQSTYAAASRTMQFRIGFTDLLELTHHRARFTQTITLTGSPAGRGDLVFDRTVRGDRLFVRITAQLLHFGSRLEPCPGASSVVDTASDVVLLSVPIRCVPASHRPARFFVQSTASRVSAQRSERRIGYDRLRTARPVLTR
jgi:hypothetical protein